MTDNTNDISNDNDLGVFVLSESEILARLRTAPEEVRRRVFVIDASVKYPFEYPIEWAAIGAARRSSSAPCGESKREKEETE